MKYIYNPVNPFFQFRIICLVCLIISVSITSVHALQSIDITRLPDNDKVIRAVITTQADLPELPHDTTTDMLLQTQGIIALVENQALTTLLKSSPRAKNNIDRPEGAATLYYIHLLGNTNTRTIEVMRTSTGWWIGEEIIHTNENENSPTNSQPMRVRINPVHLERISANWPKYLGSFSPKPITDSTTVNDPISQYIVLNKPYLCGWPFMDTQTLRRRTWPIIGNEDITTRRDLTQETLHIRLPQNYTPNKPAGLLVWINAGPSGLPPASFNQALDELNLISVGADNSGNERNAIDRYQLTLDGIATVSSRYHVEPRRIYVTGISGGGRISSMLYATVPDIITGAIPIVGINIYQAIPTGTGQYWPATYKKPPAKLFSLMKNHRIAVITGPADFNYNQCAASVHFLQSQRIDAKLFEDPNMAHEMPAPQQFLDAIKWVDEPYQMQINTEIKQAAKLLNQYLENNGEQKPKNTQDKQLLIRIMETAPWTEPAWTAFEIYNLN